MILYLGINCFVTFLEFWGFSIFRWKHVFQLTCRILLSNYEVFALLAIKITEAQTGWSLVMANMYGGLGPIVPSCNSGATGAKLWRRKNTTEIGRFFISSFFILKWMLRKFYGSWHDCLSPSGSLDIHFDICH